MPNNTYKQGIIVKISYNSVLCNYVVVVVNRKYMKLPPNYVPDYQISRMFVLTEKRLQYFRCSEKLDLCESLCVGWGGSHN